MLKEQTKILSLILLMLPMASILQAQPRYDMKTINREKLDRGVVAVRSNDKVVVSWRQLTSDSANQPFDVYRNGKKLNVQPLTSGGTFFVDEYPLKKTATYEVRGGGNNGKYTLMANAPEGYLPVKLQRPADGVTPDGETYTYSANDASVADVDGDGQYEIVLKWDPSNAHDNAHNGYTGPTIFDCYRLDGKLLWRIDMGINIRSGAHYVPFIFYDLDGDSRAEFIVRTSDGTRDGVGQVIGDAKADDRSLTGRILSGNEYITVFNGLTGKAMDTKPYIPERGNLSDWGDSYANRSDRMLAAVGYLDGKRASAIFCRGYYTRSVLAAWDWDGRELKQHWVFDTNTPEWASYAGQGNHNLRVADVDGDGCDEITYGSMAIDHDGRGLYNTGMGHGDAIHLMAFDPSTDELQVWDCHENRKDGSDFRNASTGEVIFQVPSKSDVGRCMAADIDPTNPGVEMWSSDSHGIRNIKGEVIFSAQDSDDPQHKQHLMLNGRHLSVNFGIWWDGDLLRELLDHETVSKYDWDNHTIVDVMKFPGVVFNNGTKSTPCLSADILGDWREEVIARTPDSDELRIFVSPIPTDYRITCLMEDIPYRLSTAAQNVGYNQPSEPGFYLGAEMFDARKAFALTDAFQGILPVTDAKMQKSLNGQWNLQVVEGITADASVPAADDSWRTIPVPGCWENHGFCKAKYDSPNVLTGYYRTKFSVPEEWRGQRIVLRFDGVLYGYDLWINGHLAGSWRSGYNTAMFDITDFLTQGEQELAMRVISQFPGSDFDYNDDWAPNGIFRDVTLMAVPNTHLSDLIINTKNDGTVDVKTVIANGDKNTSVIHEILDAKGQVVGSNKVINPNLWTAETPYLYTLRTTLKQKGKTLQTFHHKFGFRELTLDGKVIKLNGKAIKFRGVTSHSTYPKTGKVISDSLTLKDMKLMKDASVNYIRTSHYPREPRFYELADSLGFYIINEVPFGYGDKNLYKKEFYPVLQQRAQATIRRDKNHPSVLIWSLGNENPLTDICVQLGHYVKSELDSIRPICYPQIGSYFRGFNYHFPQVADIYTPHYPTTEQLNDFYQRADRPVIFTEYLHTLGISFEDHDRQWEIIERTPWLAGGSVWEWVDQGLSSPQSGKARRDQNKKKYGYSENVYTSSNDVFEMCGNKGTDGLLYADRTPLPNYYELQHNYARAFVESIDGDVLKISNRYDFLNLKDNVTFRWTLTNNRDTVKRGTFSPECEPHSSTTYQLELPRQNGLSLLQFDMTDAQGHTFLHQSFVLNKPENLFDSLLLTSHTSLPIQEGPMVRVGRKPTLAETLKVKNESIARYLQPLDNPYVKGEVKSDGVNYSYTLTPVDTVRHFLGELGIAWLLDTSIDRVQWIGNGPYASYPGRQQANRYGIWSMQKDDLYFEGNRMGIDAAWFSDKDGNGILITGNQLNINFEQTDCGLVVTVNAAVSGQGPKFSKTAFGVWSNEIGAHTGTFQIIATQSGKSFSPFASPVLIPAAFHPFITQYDTYLMKYSDITVYSPTTGL